MTHSAKKRLIPVALWSADYTQINGQALVTARVVHNQSAIDWREHIYRGAGLCSLATWAGAVIRLWQDIAFGRVVTLYLVCSRSDGGFLRDVPALLASWAGVRVVVHAHGSDIVDLLSSRRLSSIARALYARCKIIVPSKHLLEPLRNVTTAALHLCENYFEGVLAEEAVNPNPLSDTLTLLWNSNVMASKGFFDLAEAVRQVRGEGFTVRLISVGRPLGDEEMQASETKSRLAGLSTEGWFEYRGSIEPTAVAALAANADAVCLPSRYSSECQPLSLIQAMCAGKAIVVTDTPALRTTLGDYPAHYVPVRSVASIANALRDLHRSKQADPAAFASSRRDATIAAQERFSGDRFDREMTAILLPGTTTASSLRL